MYIHYILHAHSLAQHNNSSLSKQAHIHDLDGFTSTLDQSVDTAVPIADNKQSVSLYVWEETITNYLPQQAVEHTKY